MKRNMLTAMIAAGALAFGGAAFAQSTTHSPSGSTNGSPAISPGGSSGTSSGAPGAGTRSGAGMNSGAAETMGAKPATPPQTIVGKNVVNTKGDAIGEVKAVHGDQVIVSVGGFLGIGSRDVALNWSELTMSGSGDNAKLQTSMTKDELKSLPEYKASNSSSGSSSNGSSSTSSPSRGGMRSR
jgi:hypothetical protein